MAQRFWKRNRGPMLRASVLSANNNGPASLSPRLRTDQRDSGLVACELGQLRIVAKPQAEHVAIALDADCFPPAVLVALLRDDEVARADVVPGLWQARRDGRQVFVLATGRTWCACERRDDLAVQALPNVRH